MGGVAKRVLELADLAVLRHVDPPVDHVLAFVIARRQPQRLDDAPRRLAVAIDRFVGYLDAHERLNNRKPELPGQAYDLSSRLVRQGHLKATWETGFRRNDRLPAVKPGDLLDERQAEPRPLGVAGE